MIDHEMIRL